MRICTNPWKRFKDLPTDNRERKYKILRNKVTLEISTAKNKFENKLAENIKEDPKSFYSCVKSKSRTVVKVGPLMDENGMLVTDSRAMGSFK